MEKDEKKNYFTIGVSRSSENASERLGLFYVLSFSPLARHRKRPNPRKIG